MSLLHSTSIYQSTNKTAYRERSDYGFVIALICMAFALVVAGAIFTPVTVGSGINSEISLVGP